MYSREENVFVWSLGAYLKLTEDTHPIGSSFYEKISRKTVTLSEEIYFRVEWV